MSNVNQSFALLDKYTGDELFPYMKLQKTTGRFGFALSRPGEQDRHGNGDYTTDIKEVIRRVVIDGWNVRVKTTNRIGRQRDGSLGLGKIAITDYWVSPEHLDIVKVASIQPRVALPSTQRTLDSASAISLSSDERNPAQDASVNSPVNLEQNVSLYPEDESDGIRSEANELSALLDGFDGEDQDVLAKRRMNQGRFRRSLLRYWLGKCCMSNVTDERLLVASHIVPWSQASKQERGDPANGLLLSVVWDALFDRGLVSFRDDGNAIFDKLDRDLLGAFGIDETTVPISSEKLTSRHKSYLKRHRQLFAFE